MTASEDDSSPIIMVWDLRNARAPEKVKPESPLIDPFTKKRDMIDTHGTRKRRPIPLMV